MARAVAREADEAPAADGRRKWGATAARRPAREPAHTYGWWRATGLGSSLRPPLQRRVGILQMLDAHALQLDGHGEFGDDGLYAPALLIDQVILADLQARLAAGRERVTPRDKSCCGDRVLGTATAQEPVAASTYRKQSPGSSECQRAASLLPEEQRTLCVELSPATFGQFWVMAYGGSGKYGSLSNEESVTYRPSYPPDGSNPTLTAIWR